MNIRNIASALLLIIASTYAHCASNVVPLPDLQPGKVIELRVAYVVNPRLTRLSDTQLNILLDAIRDTTRQHFGVTLSFAPVQLLSIESVFSKITPEAVRNGDRYIYDFKSGKGDPVRLAEAYTKEIKEKYSGRLADQIGYVQPFFKPSQNSPDALGEAAARYHLSRIDRWKNLTALDGGAVIDDKPYNEYMHWVSLGYTQLPFELLLTNQPIVSAEYLSPALATAIRGGYSNGVTTVSRSSRTGTVSIWSTFAFTADDPWVTQLRDGERYEAEEAAQLAGVGAAHEIGHQLFHINHPFGNRACVMNPVPMFAYRAWAKGLSPKDCPLGSSPAMTPGAYKFIDHAAPN
jgi:hypothetical protein